MGFIGNFSFILSQMIYRKKSFISFLIDSTKLKSLKKINFEVNKRMFPILDVENIILPFSHNLEFMFLSHFSFVLWTYC
jgi:hypothetical protein